MHVATLMLEHESQADTKALVGAGNAADPQEGQEGVVCQLRIQHYKVIQPHKWVTMDFQFHATAMDGDISS